MKISELIVQLLPLLHEHGDVDTTIQDSEYGFYDPDPEFVLGTVWL